ncbi:Pol polyprotein [Smittium culicis]|uniref:Pol polyprotein n=1 Tax=Smittium culicis TaxID=133412 RepID=A0A1R1X090_9FUNG|nr:Pol polyprotein [Smittium culicis]
MEEFHTKQENLIDGCEEVFATEKRRIRLKPPQLNKKVILSSEKDSENIAAAIKVKKLISIRKKGEIGLVGGIKAYSIKESLYSSDENISIAQLLQVSPEIRQELGKLSKKTEIPSLINYVEKEKENEVTNFKALVKIFGERYWAVVDTGAASSDVSKPLLDKIGITADHKSSQFIITADGNRHDTYGHVLDVPIEISNYYFNVDFIVMDQNKKDLILGVDSLKKSTVIIDMNNNLLIFPKEEYEIVLSLSTNRIEESGHNEIFGIGKGVYFTEFEKGNMNDPRIEKFLADNSEVLASDISELTQTTAITYKIDTGHEPTIKMKPYRIPKSMKEARNEIEIEQRKMTLWKGGNRVFRACNIKKWNQNKQMIEAISKLPEPKNVKEIQSFLGTTGLARWSMLLKEYDYDITHRKESKNPSDYLSRAPRNSKAQNDLIDEEDRLAEQFYEFIGINHSPNTAYWPQSNGQVERLNQTIKNVLSKLCLTEKIHWDRYLWRALLAIHSLKHRVTGFSPSEILYGFNLKTPTIWNETPTNENMTQAIEEIFKFIAEIIELLSNNASDKNAVNKKYIKNRYEENVEYKLKEGENLIRVMEQASTKFCTVPEGPFKITEACGKDAYRISDSFGTEYLVNGDRLKTYKESGKMIPEVRPAALRPTIKRFRETIRFGRDSRI